MPLMNFEDVLSLIEIRSLHDIHRNEDDDDGDGDDDDDDYVGKASHGDWKKVRNKP